MRTTVDVDKKLLDMLIEVSGEKSVTRLVNQALAEYLQQIRAERLIASLGTWDLDLDDWSKVRHEERT